MKQYAKLYNDNLIYHIPGSGLITDSGVIFNPSERVLLENGYKEVIRQLVPSLEFYQAYKEIYTEGTETITVSYEIFDIEITKEVFDKQYNKEVLFLIKQKYTLDEEMAINRKMNNLLRLNKSDLHIETEFRDYYDYVESCKLSVSEKYKDLVIQEDPVEEIVE